MERCRWRCRCGWGFLRCARINLLADGQPDDPMDVDVDVDVLAQGSGYSVVTRVSKIDVDDFMMNSG